MKRKTAAPAAAAAGAPPEAQGRSDELQLVTFSLGAEEFGVPIGFVKEIVRVPEITRIPKVPAFVEGIANLRGSILPIVNLRARFELEEAERTEDNRVLVVEVGGRMTGLVVDEVSEVMRIAADCIEPPPPVVSATIDASFLRGVAKLHEGRRLTLLLEVEQVIPADGGGVAATAQRAAAAAAKSDVQVRASRQARDAEQVVSFRLGAEEYAVALTEVQEIIRVPEVSRVPKAPRYVEGVVALRNRLLPILNLRTRFGLGSTAAEGDEDDRRIIVLNLGGTLAGVLVDSVAEVMSIPTDAVEAAPALVSASDADRLRGVAKLDDGRRLVMLLDMARMLAGGELAGLAELATAPEDAPAAGAGEAGGAEAGERRAVEEEQFVGFRVADEEFGVGIQEVQEIINLPEVTRVPRSPYFVEGIINLRGNVLPVIDLRKRFSLPALAEGETASIVIVDGRRGKTGIIVDAMSGVLRVGRSEIEAPPQVVAGGIDASCVRGIGKLQGGERMLIVLDVNRVLEEGDGLAAA